MLATKKYFQNLREKSFMKISQETEKLILEKLEKEPEPDENGHIQVYRARYLGTDKENN